MERHPSNRSKLFFRLRVLRQHWLTEMIVGVAFQLPTKVILYMQAPYRHHDIIKRTKHFTNVIDNIVEGFVTDAGQFLNRVEAKKHVLECGQPTIGDHHEFELFSEDVW